MARPTKYDEDLGQLILRRYLLEVDSRAEAAKSVGVCVRTLQGWLARGRQEVEDGKRGPLADFAKRFDRVDDIKRRIRFEAAWAREDARSKERWQRFKAAREQWWLERLGPRRFWLRRLEWATVKGKYRAAEKARAELRKLVEAEAARRSKAEA